MKTKNKLTKITIIALITLCVLGMTQCASARCVEHWWGHVEEGQIYSTMSDIFNYYKMCPNSKDGDDLCIAACSELAKKLVKNGYAKWLDHDGDMYWTIQITNKSSESLNKKGYFEHYVEGPFFTDYRLRVFINTNSSLWKNPF